MFMHICCSTLNYYVHSTTSYDIRTLNLIPLHLISGEVCQPFLISLRKEILVKKLTHWKNNMC